MKKVRAFMVYIKDNNIFGREKDKRALRTENSVFISLLENDIKQNEKFLNEIQDDKLIGELRDFEIRKETFKLNEKSFEDRKIISSEQKDRTD